VKPEGWAPGIAAALTYDFKGDEEAVELRQTVNRDGMAGPCARCPASPEGMSWWDWF